MALAAVDGKGDTRGASSRPSRQASRPERALESRLHELNARLVDSDVERERQAAENARLAGRLHLLLEVLPGAVVVLDPTGRVREFNPAATDLFGAGLQGRQWRDVVAASFVASPYSGPDALLQDGRRVTIATRSLGAEPGQILLLTEVTETRALEERLRRMQRISELGNMMAAFAHQIRTPIAAALLDASNLRGGEPRTSPRRRVHDRVLERLRHLERLVEDMLIFARQGALQVGSLDLCALLRECAAELEPRARADSSRIEVAAPASALELDGNAGALRGAFSNLVANALEAGGPGTRVDLVLRQASGSACVDVIDDGPGMAPDLHERIFEPFFSTKADGNGLGMAIAQSIFEAHGGDISLVSSTARGTRFRMCLPVRPARGADSETTRTRTDGTDGELT